MTSFPDATNTGVPAGTSLKSSGGLTLSTSGQVVSGLNINGNVNIHASNVTLENCIIHVTDPTQFAGIAVLGGLTGVTIKNCTIIGPGPSATTQFYGVDVLGDSQVTVDSCNISQVAHGVQVSAGQVVVENNYIHGLNSTSSSHYEDIFYGGGGGPDFSLLIQHNSLINENGWTASVFLQNYFGPVSNVTVNDNLLVGGGYTVYDDSTRSGGPGSHVSFTNNHMGKGQYGYTYFMGSDNPVYTGNVNDGAALAATLNTAANTGGSTSPPVTTPSAAAAPVIASFSPDSGVVGDGITKANTLDLKGTAVPNSTITVYDGSTKLGTTTATSTGSWDYITKVLTDAKHVLTATETNASGQTSAASAALTVTVDTHVPAAPILVSDSVVNSGQVLLSGTAEANSTITVYDGTAAVGTTTAGANGAWNVTTSALPTGSQILIATATDAAGNTSAQSAPLDPVIQAPTTGGGQAPSGGQNLVTNGSFETGDYTGWTLGGNYKPLSTGAQTFIVTGAESGKFAAGLGSVGSDATLSQNVQTTAGQQYAVSFWLANQKSGPNDFTVTWNGQTELALVNKSAQGYTQYSFTATGTAGTSHLEFDARQDPAYWSLDNVSVVTVGSQPTGGGQAPSGGQPSSGGQNLVTNGSFETGDYTGWTLGGNYKPLSTGAQTYILTGAESGKFAAALGSVGSDATLGQNVQTTAGQQYAVSFWLANKGSGPNDFTVTWNGQTELALANKSAQGYTQYSFTATGTAGSSHLEFDARNDPAHWSLDNVSVVAVGSSQPLPHFATGGSFTVGGQGGADSQLVQFMATPGEVVTLTPVAVGSQPSQPLPHFATGGSFTVGGQGGTDSQLVQFMATPGEVVTVTPPGGSTVKMASPTTPTLAPTKPLELTNLQTHLNDTAKINGTADANSQIKLYDGTSSLGSVKAGADGTWSFTTAQLSNAVHTFKAQEVDSTGHVVATSSGNAVLGSPSGNSTLTSTTGNDVLVGQGHSDTFVFAPNFGNDTVKGFTAGGSGHDTIQFSHSVFDSFATVLSHASQVGQDVVISSGNETLKLLNTKLSALNSHDFHFA